MKQELIKEKQEKLGKVVWNVEVMRKRLKIQEKSQILENLHKNMDKKLQEIEKKLKAMELILLEDIESTEGNKQIKRDVLVELVEKVREDLVKRMEEGMKAVSKYVQEVLGNQGTWKNKKEFEELKINHQELLEKSKKDHENNKEMQEKINSLSQQVHLLTERKKSLKTSLGVLIKEKSKAEKYALDIESCPPVKLPEQLEDLSVKSEGRNLPRKEFESKHQEELQKIINQYQAVVLGFKK